MNSTHAAQAIHTPDTGSQERQQILDVAHQAVSHKLGRDVRFDIAQIRAGGGWGFLYAHMLQADGSPIDYAGTPMADAAAQGYVSPDYVALMKQGDNGWELRASAVGPTDMVWLAWPEKYGAPHDLFEE